MDNQNQHIDSSLDDLLEETDELTEVSTEVINRVTTWETALAVSDLYLSNAA